MEYKIAVEDITTFNVKFTLKTGGVHKTFSFELTAERLPQEEINARLENKQGTLSDFMRPLLQGWSGQKLVLNQDGTPADFNDDSRDAMLNVAGVGTVIFNSYVAEAGAKAKN